MVTAHADTAPVAAASVDWLTEATAVGVRLVAPHVNGDRVNVAVTGSLADVPPFRSRLDRALRRWVSPRCTLVDRQLGPVAGAVLTALQNYGAGVDDVVMERLRQLDHTG